MLFLSKIRSIFFRIIVASITILPIVSCSMNPALHLEDTTYTDVNTSQDISRDNRDRPESIVKDGPPKSPTNVSLIPDAVPIVHLGPYKNNSYTIFGKTYFPMKESKGYVAFGKASWYGTKFQGKNTANGEIYDLYGMTAAHRTLPLPSYVKVTNIANNRSVILRVNDRGPFRPDRIIDLSYAAAKKLRFIKDGLAEVKVETIDPKVWDNKGKETF